MVPMCADVSDVLAFIVFEAGGRLGTGPCAAAAAGPINRALSASSLLVARQKAGATVAAVATRRPKRWADLIAFARKMLRIVLKIGTGTESIRK